MAKKKQVKNIPAAKSTSPDLDLLIDKYIWLLIPIFTVIYYLSSKYSIGFSQDDEIGHFVNMKEFWTDPLSIIGNWPKPGYKILMVVPALFGYQAVLLVNSLIAATTVYLTYRLLKLYNINYAFFGAFMLGLQPLFFDLSFRSYAEIFTALLFVVLIILYKKESYFLCGLVCGYIFTVRQEAVLIGIFLAIIFFQRKNYTAILSIGIFPFLFNLFGYFKTGDYLFVISEMSSLGAMDFGGASRGFFHYFKVYIFIVGPVCLTLFLLGYFGFLADTKKFKEYIKKYDIVYVVFTLTFMVQVLLMLKGTNPGTWRYLLHISPLAAFFATVGLNNLASVQFKKTNYIITGTFLIITLAVLSRISKGLDLFEIPEYGKFAVVSIVFLLTVILFSNDTRAYLNKLSVTLIILSAVYLFMSFEPRVLSAENIAVKQTAEYLAKSEYENKEIYVTVQLTNSIILFGDVSPEGRKKFIHLNQENLSKAKKGDLVIWDTHYGYRPEYKNDVKPDDLDENPDFKMIKKITSSDNMFEAYVYEKIN
ncbi:MAG: hypothetical protein IPL53_18185 [Ignavibacteria bacterium]|nr:hypothetical protein [Ignavibacteria bacterium]